MRAEPFNSGIESRIKRLTEIVYRNSEIVCQTVRRSAGENAAGLRER